MEVAEQQKYPVTTKDKITLDPPNPPDPDEKTPVGGFDPIELIKAPVTPPNSGVSESRHATSNPRVRFLMYASMALFLIGLLLLLVNVFVGIVIMILSALSVILSVFAPID